MANPSGNTEKGLLSGNCVDLISLCCSDRDLLWLPRSTPEYALPMVFKGRSVWFEASGQTKGVARNAD